LNSLNQADFDMPIWFDRFCAGDGETMDEFEERLFGGKDTDKGSLYEKLDRAENTGRRYNMGSGMGGLTGLSDKSRSGLSKGGFTWLSDSSSSGFPGFPASGDRSNSGWMDGYDSFNDGLNDTIANAARNIQMEEDEDVDGDWEDDFEFRPDVRFRQGSTYSVRVSSSLVCQ
jgi:hypothetical protein